MENTIDKLLRLKDVSEIVGLKHAAIYKQISRGTFPRPLKLGERAVAWKLSEVRGWIESRERA